MKFKLTTNTKMLLGKKLFQIKALISFGNVEKGDFGGYVEAESNLSQYGNAWVYGDARVYGNARVSGDARVYGDARVSGDAWVYGDADVLWFSRVGSENGTLTACKNKDGSIWVSRGCFNGSIDQFNEEVNSTHRESKVAREYRLLIDFIKLRFSEND